MGIASPDVYAQCTGTGAEFGGGRTLNALTSMIGTVNTAFLANGGPLVVTPPSEPNRQSGGAWAKAIGGKVTTEGNSSFTGSYDITIEYPLTGEEEHTQSEANVACRTRAQQEFAGVKVGQDIGVLNYGGSGANMHLGVMAGYISAHLKDITPANPDLPVDEVLKGGFEVPFAGIYSTYSKGNFYANTEARLDFFQGNLLGQHLDGRGYSLAGNMGYRIPLGGNWSLEPSVGGVYSRASFNQFDASGVLNVPFASANRASLVFGTMNINDVESILGRGSLKLSTSLSLDNGKILAVPVAMVSVFHEFAGDVTGSATSDGQFGNLDELAIVRYQGGGNYTASRVGTYGKFSLGSSFLFRDTGWLAFGLVNYRIGENIEGVSANAGLRYQINPVAGGLEKGGSLKDAPAEGYSWAGPYATLAAGAMWGETPWTYWIPGQGGLAPQFTGYLGSVHAGYNIQAGRFVWGVEGGYGLSNAKGGRPKPGISYYGFEDEVSELGTLTARLGYTWGRALFYAKGGWAFGKVMEGTYKIPAPITIPGGTATTTKWENGWTAGGGVELALNEKWSVRAEYMHFELGREKFLVVGDPGSHYVDAPAIGNSVQIGVTYHLAPR